MLFDPRIESIRPLPRRPHWVRLVLSDGCTLDLHESRCVKLHLRHGRTLDDDALAAARDAAEIDALKHRALRLLTRRAHARLELRNKLVPHAADPRHLDAALDELERDGLVNDQAFATRLFESETSRGPARAGIARAKLERAGIDPGSVAAAADAHAIDPLAEAVALVRQRLRPADRADPHKAAARLFRLLASRGFDEDTARSALESVLGTIEHDQTD
ncbi:MAG: recombination regulator RecX [Phycisphaerales bacterium]|nr:recombination regulator RecX [Phycisphaerales bacterium]